jgi:hypothetical protein
MHEDEPESRKWTDENGTRWHSMSGMTLYQRPGERSWTMRPPTPQERQHNTEQLAAYRAEEWAGTVAAYAANPADVLAAWRYLPSRRPAMTTQRDDLSQMRADGSLWNAPASLEALACRM